MKTAAFADKKGVLFALMIGVFLSPINVNFTSVALPSLREYYSISVEQVSWVGTAYFIPTVALMPVLAAVGQRWGLRRMYISGLLLLSLGAFSAAITTTFKGLLVSRILQGIGWSGLYPLALILIREIFPIAQQGEIMGIWESAVGIAAIVGPIIGGLLVSYFGWQSIYFGLGLIAGMGALVSIKSIPRDSQIAQAPYFDWYGALTLTAAILLFLYGITAKSALIIAVSGAVFLIWFINARRISHPFIDPKILGNRRFITAAGAANLRMVIGIACVMSLPLFLEDVQGLSPTAVGILLPIYSLFLFLGARPGGRWADRSGGRRPSVWGFILMTIGVGMLIFIDHTTGAVFIGLALMVRGIGAGISQSPFAKVATSAVKKSQIDVAAGLYGMARYSGLAIGSALVGILLNNRLSFYGSNGHGASAVPAFQELFMVLTVVGLIGMLLSWLIGSQPAKLRPAVQSTPGAANG